MWKKNVSKRSKSEGMAYKNSKGIEVRKTELKANPCIGRRCQNKCGSNWTEEERCDIFKHFWSLGHQRQRDFITMHVERVPVKRSRIKDSRDHRKKISYR